MSGGAGRRSASLSPDEVSSLDQDPAMENPDGSAEQG